MTPVPGMRPPGPWISVHELSEWVYCPRALHYARHPPAGREDPRVVERRSAGRTYHEHQLRRAVARDRGIDLAWLGAIIGVALLAGALFLAGVL